MSENTPEAEAQKVEDLPQWAQDLISNTRAEAAQHRTEKQSAVDTAKAALADEHTAAIAELNGKVSTAETERDSARLEVTKLKAALAVGIDGERAIGFAELLKGDDEDQIRSHADEVRKLFGDKKPAKTPATDPSQGSGNSNPLPLNGDPLLDALKKKVGVK
ncbi:scaffolding protein [Rhodococcus phage Krishelle]|uniref:Scaffolding protein n=1 Tax=Rhodococcus phage Krishelle TaxID=2015829 RepID=A0A222ZJL7_9CAUD|nr:scaffolding protein [Rhodococcus phage Krishelle]